MFAYMHVVREDIYIYDNLGVDTCMDNNIIIIAFPETCQPDKPSIQIHVDPAKYYRIVPYILLGESIMLMRHVTIR